MIPVNLGNQLQVIDILPVESVNADGNGSAIDLKDIEGQIAVVIDCKNVSGTAPTFDIKIQHSDTTTSGDFSDVSGAAFTQVTTVASVEKIALNSDSLKRYIRVVKDVGGTTPVYLLSVKGYGMKKYQD